MIALRCGAGMLYAEPPASWHTVRLDPSSTESGRREAEVVARALDEPADAEPLEEFIEKSDRVAIVVPDKTRRSRIDIVLPHVLARIHAGGVPPGNVTIVFARGTHAAQDAATQRSILGPDIFERYRVVDHDSHERAAMVHVGTTTAGTEVLLNRCVASADKVVAVGTVLHHYFAGYGGGPKLLMPGTAAYESAVQNHRRVLLPDGRFHPACREGSVAGNPVAEDIIDAARFFPPCTYLGLVLDAEERVAHAVYGDILAAHRQACILADTMYRLTVTAHSDVTLVSAGGRPRDMTFIQSHKALHRAVRITRPGGVVVCAAACDEGIGNDEFLEWFRFADPAALREALRERYTMNAHTAVSVMAKTASRTVFLVSTLPREDVRAMGMHPCTTLQEAVDAAAELVPPSALAYVLERGGLFFPVLAGENDGNAQIP
ncbi:MAG: nickel-dependent lactate racemase [Bacteroidota bacterium]|nr:nickel-dependent lactate racemase [Bacteroidota bacterium]